MPAWYVDVLVHKHNKKSPKGSVDNDLQNMVRDNLYLRTLPCTTRPPREGEQNGVDYTFLTKEQFQGMLRRLLFALEVASRSNYAL